MTQEELKKVLKLHKKWLNNEADGVRASLCRANLRGADLCGANMCEAGLRRADLRGADLCGADLCGAKNIPFIPLACPEKGSSQRSKNVAHTLSNF